MNKDLEKSFDHAQDKHQKELLEKIGKLYFENNGIKVRKCFFWSKIWWSLIDWPYSYLNITLIIINTALIAIFIFISIPKTSFLIFVFILMMIFVFAMESAIFYPALSRKTATQMLEEMYQKIAKQLIGILQPRLYNFFCNRDGTVKDFVSDVAAVFFCEKLGSVICTHFAITPDLVQLIILYLTNKGLKNFCSITQSYLSDSDLGAQLSNLKCKMLTTSEKLRTFKR